LPENVPKLVSRGSISLPDKPLHPATVKAMMIILNKRAHFKELFVIYANLNYQILTTADQGRLAGRYDSVRHLPIAVVAAIHFMSAVAILRPMTASQALQKCSRAGGMTNIFLVMAGGAVGSALRYLIGRLAVQMIPGASWPWGTFAANVVGGFAMGLLAGWLARFNTSAGEPIRLLLAVGLLGGFTTFSSFSLETVLMMERGQMGVALAYAVLSVIGAVGALAGGLAFMRSIA